ncbi:MAG: hypothetical protein WCE75_05705 [Terracidiphilus sp.]
MAVSAGIRRLLRVRSLEEEQSRQVLESALGELERIEHALAAASQAERAGRLLLKGSVEQGDLTGRLAGLQQVLACERHSAFLAPRREEAAEDVADLREEFLFRRVERRQAETLIEEGEAAEAAEADRRSQQSTDDWYSGRLHRGSVVEGMGRARAARAYAAEGVTRSSARSEQS